eukprot:367571-Amphidinium_carterae.1
MSSSSIGCCTGQSIVNLQSHVDVIQDMGARAQPAAVVHPIADISPTKFGTQATRPQIIQKMLEMSGKLEQKHGEVTVCEESSTSLRAFFFPGTVLTCYRTNVI